MGDRPLILVYEFRPQTGRKADRLMVQVSGGALTRKKQRRPVNQNQSRIRENRDDTILRAGLRKSCSFFCPRQLGFSTRWNSSEKITRARESSTRYWPSSC